jgi:acetolactate synthase-1/2/3 large subunit
MLGMHGTYRANMSVMDADLLIAIGTRFDDRVTGKTEAFAPHAKIIHVDIDPTSISKNVRVDLPIVGDCKRVLSKWLAMLEEEEIEPFQARPEKWHHQVEKWKSEHTMAYQQTNKIKPQYVIERSELTKGDAIITTEVGQNQMWAAQFYHFLKPRTLLTSGAWARWATASPRPSELRWPFPASW